MRRRDLAQAVIYPGTCRQRQLNWGWQAERLPAWRLRLDNAAAFDCGDVVVRRADGFIAYHLATAVDELTCGITTVVRGADRRRCVLRGGGDGRSRATRTAVRHVPLLCDAAGQKLAKREAARAWRHGVSAKRPEEVVGHLAAQLQLVPETCVLSARDLLQELKGSGRALAALLQP